VLQARPLYDTDPDAELFVEPASWKRLVGAVGRRFNVAVVGARGAGKTSALRQLQRRLRAGGVHVIFVDATGAEDVGQLVTLIEAEMLGRRGALAEMGSDLAPEAGALAGGPPGSTSLRVVQRIRALGEQPAAVVLVDCAHGARAAYALFGRMRDELWQMQHRWVVAVEDSERSILLSPPADAFFDLVVSVGMSAPELLELLRARRPDLPDAGLRDIAEQTPTPTPRAALQSVREAVLSSAADDPLAATMWRQEGARKLGRPHSMAMEELEALGGASASDEELLRRLGWTRARASQVLGELAEADLLTALDERSAGAGRPRRVFRPAEPPPGVARPSGATELPVREA
jgi:hypothetical protein